MSNQFIESHVLHRWVCRLLYLQILISSVMIIFNVMEYQVLTAFEQQNYETYEHISKEIDDSDLRQSIVSMIYLLNFVIVGFLILKWIYRANQNAKNLGAKHMHFSPGWSIGFYFIPIFNLWKPYNAMIEIWQASKNPDHWPSQTVSSYVPCWWFLWIVSNFLGRLIYRWSNKAEEISAFITINILDQISNVLDILLCIVLLIIMQKITQMQAVQFEKQNCVDDKSEEELEKLVL